jgi:hypothetical protein
VNISWAPKTVSRGRNREEGVARWNVCSGRSAAWERQRRLRSPISPKPTTVTSRQSIRHSSATSCARQVHGVNTRSMHRKVFVRATGTYLSDERGAGCHRRERQEVAEPDSVRRRQLQQRNLSWGTRRY